MSKLPAMKFKVRDEKHSEEIQKKLFEMGYGWCGDQKCVQCPNERFLYTDSDGFLTYSGSYDAGFFDDHHAEEHFLTVGGEFVTAGYFTQPKSIIPPKSNAELLAAMQQRFDSTKPPIGLKPRKEHDRARLVEIAEAIVRYAQAGKKSPEEWWGEAKYINEFMEG